MADVNGLYELEDSIIITTFGNTAELRIIDFLLDNPRHDFSRKEIREAIGSTKRTLTEKIPKLESLGIIKESRKIGKTTMYRINLDNEAVRGLRSVERSISLQAAEDELENELEKEDLLVT
jgi:DNA-binding transcriptional ArsR family regulator